MRKTTLYGLLAALAVLLMMCALGLALSGQESPRRIEITAKRFSFEPDEITIKRGETVVLALHSTDVPHGLEIKGLGVKTDIPKGRVVEISVTPAVAGDFDGTCSYFCGIGHGSMIFTIHVVEQ